MKIASRVKLASRSTDVVGGDHADYRGHDDPADPGGPGDHEDHGDQSDLVDLGDQADPAGQYDPGDHTDQSDHADQSDHSSHARHVVGGDHDGRLCSKKSCHRELRAFIFSSCDWDCDCDPDICKYIDVLEAIQTIICSYILQTKFSTQIPSS